MRQVDGPLSLYICVFITCLCCKGSLICSSTKCRMYGWSSQRAPLLSLCLETRVSDGVLSQHAKSYDRSHPDEMDDDAASSWSWSQHHTDLCSLNTSEPIWIVGTLMFNDWQTDRWSDIHSENLWSLRIGVKIGRPGALLYSNLCNLCSLPVYSFVRRRSRDVFIRVLAGSSFFFLC